MSHIGINGRQLGGRESVLGAPVFAICRRIASAAGTRFILASPVGCNLRVIQVEVHCRAASAGATVQLFKNVAGGVLAGDLAVSDAIAAVVADTLYIATTLDDTRCHFDTNDMMGLTVGIGAGTNDFDVYVLCVREDA